MFTRVMHKLCESFGRILFSFSMNKLSEIVLENLLRTGVARPPRPADGVQYELIWFNRADTFQIRASPTRTIGK